MLILRNYAHCTLNIKDKVWLTYGASQSEGICFYSSDLLKKERVCLT